jgi:hypothetical protein
MYCGSVPEHGARQTKWKEAGNLGCYLRGNDVSYFEKAHRVEQSCSTILFLNLGDA